MDDRLVAKLSLCCSVFGLLLLFIASGFVEAEKVGISELENAEAKDVLIRGQVVSVRDFGNLAVVEVAEIKSVGVVVFDMRMLKFRVGDNVSVSGELRDYKGRKEIVAGRIKVNG